MAVGFMTPGAAAASLMTRLPMSTRCDKATALIKLGRVKAELARQVS